MRWGKSLSEKSESQSFLRNNWTPWFAWYPISIFDWSNREHNGKYVWLEWIERKQDDWGDWTYFRLPEPKPESSEHK